MSRKITLLASLAALPVLLLGIPAFAQEAPTGQFEGGNIYRVANITKNTDFVDPATATCGDTLQFRVRVHNIGANPAENVKVSATLPSGTATSHSSMVTVKGSNTNTVTDTAGVNLDKAGKLTYVAGSTELLDANQAKLSGLADGIIGGGVTLPDAVGVSTQQKRSVQFQAKVTCETVEIKDIQVCELSTKKIITIKENQFDSSKHSRNFADCATPGNIVVCEVATKRVITIKENEFDAAKHTRDMSSCNVTPVTPTTTTTPTPAVLPNTGVSEIIGMFAAVAVAGAIAHRFILARR